MYPIQCLKCGKSFDAERAQTIRSEGTQYAVCPDGHRVHLEKAMDRAAYLAGKQEISFIKRLLKGMFG